MKTHRKPAVAGLFYPADPERLTDQLNNFFSGTRRQSGQKVRYLISPHAGFVYSGKIAAEAFSEAADGSYDRVILLGPSHRYYFEGAVESGSDFWELPTGTVQLELTDSNKIQKNAAYHKDEHCLEVQVPFLLHLFPDTPITPILLSGGYHMADEIARILHPFDNDRTLWVISSDFNHVGPNFRHFPDQFGYSSGEAMDREAIDLIAGGDREGLIAFMKRTRATICGALPILVAMHLIEKSGHPSFSFKKYDCSGKQTGDINSVGYAALYS